jgi:GxxExxY protein
MHENEISGIVVGAAFKVHTSLGPGLLESVYEKILAYELRKRGLRVEVQQPVPIQYDNLYFDKGYRLDLLVEDKVIVEIKSIEEVAPIHKKQLLTYLKLKNKRLGLLINFNVELIKQGITRAVNGLEG